jgi:choline/glycine/proline betaine transport protein
MQLPSQADQSGDRLNPVVFFGSSILIVLFALWTMFFTEAADATVGGLLSWVSTNFGWYYFLTVVIYLAFVIVIAATKLGDIKLGPDHSKPEFNIISWASMLFAAGIGIDLLFYCIYEPLIMYMNPPVGEGETLESAREAMRLTFLHWGISGWGIYTLVGMSLAYFSYRHRLPLTIRSALYPIFGERIYGPIGHVVDIAAVLGTVFGIATSLGIGVIQLNEGLSNMFGMPKNTWIQAGLIVMIVIFATLSAVSGVEKGIRRLSEFNMGLAALLVLFVLFAGPTVFLLNALVMNVGDYLTSFVNMSFNTYAYDQPTEWLGWWTIFFWAWWIAWGPFVGLFLARISRGRTIRQFTVGTLVLPMSFMMIWMGIMGNSAIELVMNGGAQEFKEGASAAPAASIYLFMEQLPWAAMTTIVVSILAIVFFVTSGDSGALVLSNFTSILTDVDHDAPTWMRTLWAAIIGLLTLALLMAGGLQALQSAVVVMGLPFSIVLFFMMVGLYKALKTESLKKRLRPAPAGATSGGDGSAPNWRQRLTRAMSFPTHDEAVTFMDQTVKPAMEAIRDELAKQDLTAEISRSSDPEHIALEVNLGEEGVFTYQAWPRSAPIPAFAIRPHTGTNTYYQLEVHLEEGGQGYDLMDYSEAQIIEDILDQYERHLAYLERCREAPGDVSMPGRGQHLTE